MLREFNELQKAELKRLSRQLRVAMPNKRQLTDPAWCTARMNMCLARLAKKQQDKAEKQNETATQPDLFSSKPTAEIKPAVDFKSRAAGDY